MTDETQGTAETLAEGVVELPNPNAAEVTAGTTETRPEGETKPEGETEEQQEKKKLSGAQKAKRRETYLLNQLAEANRLLEEAKRTAPAAGRETSSDEGLPKEADFNGDYFAWQQAVTAFKAGKAAENAIEKAFKTREESERSSKLQETARERQLAHLERVEDAREVIADFDKVMEGMKGVNVRPELIEAIQESDKSGLLSYHLAKNQTDLEILNSLSGKDLARAMGRIEATLEMPKAKKATTAPNPLTPLKGGASGSFDAEKADMADYVAKRKAGWKG